MDIKMGAMCPKLTEQLTTADELDDKKADAVTFLQIHGVLTDVEASKARKRILKNIEDKSKDQ